MSREERHSVWSEFSKTVEFPALSENKNTDVLIIGGGIAGILCAYKLKNDCMLAEAGEICGGITKNTTAKITLGHGLICDKMIHRFGVDKARLYTEAQQSAVEEYNRLCSNINCDYEIRDNYVYSLHDRQKIKNEVTALHRIGIKAEFSDAGNLPIKYAGAVCIKDQAQFHPLKFLYALARDLQIYEHIKIRESGNR